MSINRSERVAALILQEISSMLVKGLKDPRIGFVSVTRVLVSKDLRNAKVFVSVMGNQDERENTLNGLISAQGFIKRELGKRLRLRYIPDLIFKYDDSIAYGIHISEILDDLSKNKAEEQTEGEE